MLKNSKYIKDGVISYVDNTVIVNTDNASFANDDSLFTNTIVDIQSEVLVFELRGENQNLFSERLGVMIPKMIFIAKGYGKELSIGIRRTDIEETEEKKAKKK